jgi:hypothetical protein
MCIPTGNLSFSLKIIRSYKLLSVDKPNLTIYIFLSFRTLFLDYTGCTA